MRDNRQIKSIISQIVPAKTLQQIEFCRVEGGRLRITLTSAAWASKLRFFERQIIGELKSAALDAHTVSYHVSPSVTPVPRKTIRQANRSRSAAASIEAAAVDTAAVDTAALEGVTGEKHREVTSATSSDDHSDPLRLQLLKLAATLRKE